MADGKDPKSVRYAPGTDPVPEEAWVYEVPFDSAQWALDEPQGYETPLFPDSDVPDPDVPVEPS